MHPYKRAGALAIQVKVADVEFIAGPIELGFIGRINRAGKSELRIVRDAESVVIIVRLDDGQHRSKDFFLLNRVARLNIRNHGGLDKETLFAVSTAARDDATAFGLALFDVAVD